MKFEQTTFPTATNVVSLAQAKAHLRVEHADDESLIETLIGVAQNVVEGYTGRFLQQVEGSFYFDDFHEFMNLHAGPNLALRNSNSAEGVTYLDTAGRQTVVDLDKYVLEGKGYPARLRMLDAPSDVESDSLNAVRVDVTVGHTQTDRPDALIAAMLLIIGHLYENRQDVGQHKTHATPLASRYLMEPYRLKSFS
jgi:uncharacterized phiE125 gp8 family phage protein